MSTISEVVEARRYLLGRATDAERAALEQAYFEHDDVLDRIAAVEDDLIEDYLAGTLSPSDHARFERSYLVAPHRRDRVEAIRRVKALAAARRAEQSRPRASVLRWRGVTRQTAWLALAASVVMMASIVAWDLARSARRAGSTVSQFQPQGAPASGERRPRGASASRVVAMAIVPIGVRGDGATPTVIVPAGAESVVLPLGTDVDTRQLSVARASMRRVGGDEIWNGPVEIEPNGAAIVGRITVPAAGLVSDDFVITVFGRDRAGVEHEGARYMLRIRRD